MRRPAWGGLWTSVRTRVPRGRRGRAALVGGVLVIVGGGWAVVGRDRPRSVEATVHAFLDARRDGDCGRLVGLVSEASWSLHGELNRDQFLDQCPRVVGANRQELDEAEVEVVSTDGDHAVVNLAVPLDGVGFPGEHHGLVVIESREYQADTRSYETGTLVREHGAWRVETDQSFLGIGRSVPDTLRGYVEARSAGDCAGAIDFLSEDAWSEGGALTREQFVDRCAAAVDPDAGPTPLAIVVPRPDQVELSFDGGRVTAVAETEPGVLEPEVPEEAFRFVMEGLAWKLDRDLDAVEHAELRELVLDEPLAGFELVSDLPVGRDRSSSSRSESYAGDDAAERRDEAGFERGVDVYFDEGSRDDSLHGSVQLLLYEFEDAQGAAAYAEHMAARISASPADPALAIARGTHDRYLVAVELYDDDEPPAADLPVRAEQVLQAQIDHLADQP